MCVFPERVILKREISKVKLTNIATRILCNNNNNSRESRVSFQMLPGDNARGGLFEADSHSVS